MKKLQVAVMALNKILVIAFSIILMGCFASTRPFSKSPLDPEGFRGIKWGTDIATLKDMVFVMATGKNVKRYQRKGDELTIGKAKLDSIQYEFRNGRFCLVEIEFQGVENFNLVKETMFETYGKGRKMADNTESYFWEGEKTDIIMIFDTDIGGGITISSKKF